jgi:DNA repair protein RadC
MNRKKPELDIVNEMLEQCILAYPVSSFIISLYKQYRERGSLSKKQLQGLHAKSSQIQDIAPGKLATLQALINKMPTRYKSDLPEAKPLYEKDESTKQMIDEILAKYPEHKRVLFLNTKYENNEALSPADITDLKRLQQVLKK